jgi:hypothetical protein
LEKAICSVIIEEAFSFLKIPGAAAASEALNKIFEKKANEAKEILLEELSKGAGVFGSDEETVYTIYRYLRAAQEGSARLNLRLLAQSISGIYGQPMTANNFLYHADILASLRQEEIIIIGSYYKYFRNRNIEDDDSFGTSMKAIKDELIPNIFKTEDHFKSYVGALLRTGLIQAVSGWGALIFQPPPLLFEMGDMISIEDALTKEKVL